MGPVATATGLRLCEIAVWRPFRSYRTVPGPALPPSIASSRVVDSPVLAVRGSFACADFDRPELQFCSRHCRVMRAFREYVLVHLSTAERIASRMPVCRVNLLGLLFNTCEACDFAIDGLRHRTDRVMLSNSAGTLPLSTHASGRA